MLRVLLGACGLAYFGYVLYVDLPRVIAYVVPFSFERVAWLFGCTVLLGAGPFFSVAVFRILARRYSRVRLPYRKCLSLLLLSNLMRYLPGRFLGVVYQVSAPLGELNGASMLLINLEQLALSLVGNTLAAAGVLAIGRGRGALGLGLLGLAMPAVVFVLRARLPSGLRRWLSARAPARYREPLSKAASALTNGECWLIAAINVCSLAPYLLAWAGLARVFPLLRGEHLIELAASYLVAWAAGVIVFVTPGGLGVREAVFLLASPRAARDALALLTIFARVWHLLADCVAWLLGGFLPAFLLGSKPSSAKPGA